MTYDEVCKELMAKKIISFADIYDFSETPLENYFENFFTFCQTNLSERCKEYDIQPARFIYTNDYNINAKASFPEGFNIIQVNCGTIVKTYESLYSKNFLFKEDKEINKNYSEIETLFKIPLGFLMFQVAVQFTFYHELAHLIQKPFKVFDSLDERKHNGTEDKYSSLKHCLEFDADIHAANMIPPHILDFWKKHPDQHQTAGNLSKLLSVVVSGILNYFMIMGQCDQDIYYTESSHPHPIIRAVYITEKIIQVAEINVDFKLDSGVILQEAFNITEKFCIHHAIPNFVAKFNEIFSVHSDDIGDYIEILDTESDQFPNLVRNKFPDSV
ncbi:hypothetical protein SAMN04487898_105202 [Pedobacter sp. ok626]|nr:hypothetical protein SAMN04487898_105202 [Pedobacter sp. ok626]